MSIYQFIHPTSTFPHPSILTIHPLMCFSTARLLLSRKSKYTKYLSPYICIHLYIYVNISVRIKFSLFLHPPSKLIFLFYFAILPWGTSWKDWRWKEQERKRERERERERASGYPLTLEQSKYNETNYDGKWHYFNCNWDCNWTVKSKIVHRATPEGKRK